MKVYRPFLSLLLILSALMLIPGCSMPGFQEVEEGLQSGKPPAAQPEEGDSVVEVTLKDQVYQLKPQDSRFSVVEKGESRLVLKTTPESLALEPGAVLVSDVSSAAPSGFIRRVASVERQGEEVILATERGNLNDVFSHGRIALSTAQAVPQNSLARSAVSRTGKVAVPTDAPEGTVTPDREGFYMVRFGGSLDGVDVSFLAKIRPEISLVWEKEPNALRPKYYKTVISLDIKDLELIGLVGMSAEMDIAELELPPLTAYVGVPLVIRNTLEIELTGSILTGSAVSGGAVLESGHFTVGAEYIRGQGWNSLTEAALDPHFTRPSFDNNFFAGVVSLPQVKIQSAPYGIDELAVYAAIANENKVVYTPEDGRVSITGRAKASVGLCAELFGIMDSEYSYTHKFSPFYHFEGPLEDLTISDGTIEFTDEPQPADSFSDIQSHWAEEEIAYMINRGYVSGYPDGTFRPDRTVSRAEFACMVHGVIEPSPDPQFSGRDFTDISGHWAEEKILKLARAGWISGYPDETFRPNERVTRQEMYAILACYPGLSEGRADDMRNTLRDEHAIASWAFSAMATAYTNRLMVNYPYRQYFNPYLDATRAEVAAALYRLLVWQGGFLNAYDSPYIAE